MNKEEAKYPSQQKLLVAIDKLFTKLIRNRNSLMDDKHSEDFQENVTCLDLQIAQCIKKSAKITLGGYTNLPEEMWEWEPYFQLDAKLLPKSCHIA